MRTVPREFLSYLVMLYLNNKKQALNCQPKTMTSYILVNFANFTKMCQELYVSDEYLRSEEKCVLFKSEYFFLSL
jgi:hypothetical protein